MMIRKIIMCTLAALIICSILGNVVQANTDLNTHLNDLRSDDWIVRRDAVIALGELGETAADAVPALANLLYDELWTVRDSTARALGRIGASAVPALISALNHPDIDTQVVIIRSLESIGVSAATSVSKLRELLNGEHPNRDQAIIKAFGAMGKEAEEAVGEVAVYVGHSDIMIRFAAIQTIDKITSDSIVGPLIELIMDPQKSLEQRMAGTRALEYVTEDREDIFSSLADIFNAKNKLLRWVGATIAGNIGSRITIDNEHVVQSLFGLLDDSAWFVRSAASSALQKIDAQLDETLLPMLIDAITAGNHLTRFNAANLLAKINNETSTTTLMEQLETEKNKDVIISIVRALRTHGVSNFDFVDRTDIATLINSVKTEDAVVNLVKLLDDEAQTILENQNMTKEEYIAYMAWKNGITQHEMEASYNGYQYEVDATNPLHGAFRNSIDIRSQEGTYTLAYLYQEPLSRYYQNEHVLASILRSIDYMTRAQGSNGGFVDAGRDWPGVPNRSSAYNPVAGFTLYSMSRSIVLLHDQPAFQEALTELIDAYGLEKPHIDRRDAWITMLADAAKWITYEQRGHGPNQDVGCVVSAYTVNEAHKLLHPSNLDTLTQEELETLTTRCLESSTWWTDQGMLKERNGQDPAGYDGHYGSVTQYWLGLLTYYHADAAGRMEKYLNVLQYFYYPTNPDEKIKLYRIESVTANRRTQEKGADIVALSTSYKYHQALEHIYYHTFEALKINPRLDFPGGSHTFSESLYKYVDFMEYGQIPPESSYQIPTESSGPWIYLDPAGRTLAAKNVDGRLVYISLAARSFDEPAPYHVVGQGQGTFLLNPERQLDQQVVNSSQPYAYDIQFAPLEELVENAWELINTLL